MIRVVTQPLRSSPTENPSSPIYCESRPSLAPPRPHLFPPRVYPIAGARQCKSLFLRAPRFYMVCRLSSLALSFSTLTRSTTLSAYRSFSLLPRTLSFLRPFVRGIPASLFLSRSALCLSVFLFSVIVPHGRPPSSSSSFPPRAHPRPFPRSATPPTPSRPIQSPPRHPSFTASVAAYRLSFCHCGLFDILSTAVRAEARPSWGHREILETNDSGRKKSRTWEPILAPASRGF